MLPPALLSEERGEEVTASHHSGFDKKAHAQEPCLLLREGVTRFKIPETLWYLHALVFSENGFSQA